MVYTLEEIKKRVVPVAQKYNLPAVFLFGSYARGEATEDSDVDILIDREGSSVKSLWDLGAILNDLEEALEKEVDVTTTQTLEQSRTQERTPRFVSNVLRDRMVLYEEPAPTLDFSDFVSRCTK